MNQIQSLQNILSLFIHLFFVRYKKKTRKSNETNNIPLQIKTYWWFFNVIHNLPCMLLGVRFYLCVNLLTRSLVGDNPIIFMTSSGCERTQTHWHQTDLYKHLRVLTVSFFVSSMLLFVFPIAAVAAAWTIVDLSCHQQDIVLTSFFLCHSFSFENVICVILLYSKWVRRSTDNEIVALNRNVWKYANDFRIKSHVFWLDSIYIFFRLPCLFHSLPPSAYFFSVYFSCASQRLIPFQSTGRSIVVEMRCKHISKCEYTHWCRIASTSEREKKIPSTTSENNNNIVGFYFPLNGNLIACSLLICAEALSRLLLPCLLSILLFKISQVQWASSRKLYTK